MSDREHDFYAILGLSKGASAEEIKTAYRRMAMKYHPDRNPGDHEAELKFKEAKNAYEVLSDPQKREMYDRFGHEAFQQAGQGGQGFGGFDFRHDIQDIFGDIFGDFFGGSRGGRQRAQRGADIVFRESVTLEEAVHGLTREIEVPRMATCNECEGTGARKGSSPVDCPTCHGAGQVQIQHGFITVQQTCPQCHGQRKIIKDPCRNCRGQGQVKEHRKLTVNIPAGVDNGDRIRLASEGEAGTHGAPAGDLYIEIAVKEHPIFQRQGNDLYCEAPISFITAALGGSIDVPTLNGPVKLSIPPETQTGKLFRLRGKGIKALRASSHGDLLCRIIVETPVNLSQEQREHLQQFDQMLQKDQKSHSPKANTWFDAVKRFFTGEN